MKLLTIDDVDILLTAGDEDTPVRGNAIVSGDESFDKEAEDTILSRLNDGDIWAWCCVCVKVSPKDARLSHLSAFDYLGCCSYRNEKDFKAPGDYYDDMVTTCIDRLNNDLLKLSEE